MEDVNMQRAFNRRVTKIISVDPGLEHLKCTYLQYDVDIEGKLKVKMFLEKRM
jgi:hypothetical protein